MGEYIFFVDVDLTQGMPPLERAMGALTPHCERLVLLGVYPLAVVNPPEEINSGEN
jgi:prephenate dehydratase